MILFKSQVLCAKEFFKNVGLYMRFFLQFLCQCTPDVVTYIILKAWAMSVPKIMTKIAFAY